jgi:phenylalanyl-tRNA synthetase beta chain
MKISRDWLGDYVDLTDLSDDEIARRMTEIGHAVDSVERVAGDTVFDVEFTSNRVDAMSHLGLARELAAGFGRSLLFESMERPAETSGETDFEIRIEEPALCSRYTALLIEGVNVRPSGSRVQQRLEAVGLRPINNVVDATNYVMLAVGHPLHAFDADRLKQRSIIVRRGKPGETIRSLDGETRKLDDQTAVIADGSSAVGIGGVIGGAESEIGSSTRNVLLECAHFDAASIRRTARRLGMRTDASYRFERGVDPNDTVATALLAAAHIIAEGGGRARFPRDVVARAVAPLTVVLRSETLPAASGGAVGMGYALELFRGLGMECQSVADGLRVIVPTYRGDIHEESDLVEEVLRFFGFNNIPPSLPRVTTGDVRSDPVRETEERVRSLLSGCGLNEAITYAFVPPHWNELFSDEESLNLDNALTENISSMRLSIIPGLIEAAVYNRSYGTRDGALFEVGRTYHRHGSAILERPSVAFVMFGAAAGHWGDTRRPADFFDVKGVIETLLERSHISAQVQPLERKWLKKGQGAMATAGGREMARFGQVNRETLHGLGMKGELFAAELDLDLFAGGGTGWKMTQVSRYPGLPMVVGLMHGRDLPYARLIAEVERMKLPYVHEVGIRDRYAPDASSEEVKTTLGVWYQAADRSLTQEEVAGIHQQLVERLTAVLPVRVAAS